MGLEFGTLMSTPQQALVKQAYEQLQAGQFEDAVETFSAALSIASGDAAALRGRGLAYLQLKQWPAASGDFESATRSHPSNTDNWVELAVTLAIEGKIYPAIQTFEALLDRDPACVRGAVEFGLLYIRLGAIPRGRQLLEQALTLRPTLDQRRRPGSQDPRRDQAGPDSR